MTRLKEMIRILARYHGMNHRYNGKRTNQRSLAKQLCRLADMRYRLRRLEYIPALARHPEEER